MSDLPAWIQATGSCIACTLAALAWRASLQANRMSYKSLEIAQEQKRKDNSLRFLDEFKKSILDHQYSLSGNTHKSGQELVFSFFNSIIFRNEHEYLAGQNPRKEHYLKCEGLSFLKIPSGSYINPDSFWTTKPEGGFVLDCCSRFELFFRGVEQATFDFDTVSFELGQLMECLFLILDSTPESREKLSLQFPDYYAFYTVHAPEKFGHHNTLTATSFKAQPCSHHAPKIEIAGFN